MTNQAVPGRPPAHDLSAFDLSKRSPEQVAQSFARWKAQRKRQAEAGSARADPLPSQQPAVAATDDAAPEEPRRASAKQASTPRYSAPFSDLLAAGSEPTVQRTVWTPVAALRPLQRTASPGRRLRVMSILAGAASVLALAGGALLELGDWRDPIEVAPQVTQVRPKETPMALAAAATSVPAVEWTLQRTVDVALMKAAPDAVRPTPVPPPRAIQTANKAVPVTGDKPVLPERRGSAPETVQFVAKPYVPNVAPTPARVPAAQAAVPIPAAPVAAAAHAGDPRPDDLFQHGRDNRNGTVSSRTVNNRGASGGKPAAATGTGSAVDARSASARSGTAASGASADPRGEGSGGARVGVDSDAGAPSDASSGDASEGTSDAADAGDGGANGDGSSAGAADGGDTAGTGAGDGGAGDGGTGDTGAGSGDTGGASAGDGGTGDTNAGGGDTGGDESGDASEGGSGDGDSDAGESGAIGGAVGGALDAVGDALGDGKGNPDSNDKDQRN